MDNSSRNAIPLSVTLTNSSCNAVHFLLYTWLLQCVVLFLTGVHGTGWDVTPYSTAHYSNLPTNMLTSL